MPFGMMFIRRGSTSKCPSLSVHTSSYSLSTQRAVIDTDEQTHSDSQRTDKRSARTERECDTSASR